MATTSSIQVNRQEMAEFKREMKRMEKALDRKKINSIQRRNARPIEQDMANNAPSTRIAKMVAITTRQTKRPRAPRVGVRIGVINNDPALFPDFTAPALASVLEYGTEERFRTLESGGFITGRVSTGRMPDTHKWLRKAWDRNVKQFVNKTERSYIKAVEG